MRVAKFFATTVFALLLLGGCDQGPAEQAGEDIDEAVDETGEGIEDAGEETEETFE